MSKFLDGNRIDVIIDENKKLELRQREGKRLKNRDFFKRLIDITILLAKSGRLFREHDESIKALIKECSKRYRNYCNETELINVINLKRYATSVK